MTKRWRDKKNEPQFVFHAWMQTVDELEDQIADLVAALKAARLYVANAPTPFAFGRQARVIAVIDEAIAKVEAQL